MAFSEESGKRFFSFTMMYDVSVNYLLTGDEMFPGLRKLKKDADKILEEIEGLKPGIEW